MASPRPDRDGPARARAGRAVRFPANVVAAALLSGLTPVLPAAAESAVEVRVQITPRHATILSSEIAGKISELPFREGEAFEKGQEIASLDCDSYRARLQLADAKVSGAERKLEAIRLLDQRKAVGRIDVDLAGSEFDAAKAEQQMAAKDVSRCTVHAPFSGRIAELRVKRYQYVASGEPLADILNERELEIELLVPSRWISWLTVGTTFTTRIEELQRDYPAEVTRIVPRIDPVSQTVKLYGRIAGDRPELVAGMSGAARLAAPARAP
ncbi:efflux RND transporter periplasmic adaptor subunit [Bosea sp. WAO]|uniref:efflux RND transporter periplasmic adaptor subunit n=1 Tax=Bosea sp. WAO TaxID=406341 RepID=UPI00082B10F2|nr:efflux RND transporter periplasmic adaptor subunit [Bosea sp. WAO]